MSVTSMLIVVPMISMPRSTMIIMILRMSWSYFMKFYSIVRIIFWSIESNVRKIVPDREECCIHEIGKEELIEHENHSKWNECILMGECIIVEPWFLNHFSIIGNISDPDKDRLNLENICLINEVDTYRSKTKYQISRDNYIHECIQCRLGRFTHNQSTMNGKKNCKNKYEIDWYCNEKRRESEWKKSSCSSKRRISNEKHHQEDIDSHANNGSKCRLKNTMESNKIIEENNSHKK